MNSYLKLLSGDRSFSKVFYTKEKMMEAIDDYIKINPNVFLYYEEYIFDPKYEDMLNGWDYAYIPLNSNVEDLESGGGVAPKKHRWGTNLLRKS